MQMILKPFSALTVEELYAILKLRVDIFVVEQNCPYADLDDYDQLADHIYLSDEDGIVACARIFAPGVYFQEASVGRIVCKKRHKGYATAMLREALDYIRRTYGAVPVKIKAQTYARRLYEKVGFVQEGEPFLEDGIPHIPMICRL